MKNYQESVNTWNKVANSYQEKFMGLDLYNDTYDVFLNLITKKNASVLEIGCGPGNITKYLLSKKASLKIKGIDISENMIALARKNNPSAEFEIMDSRNIDNLNIKFDAIISGFCIPYLSKDDCSKLLADCKNLLNNSGILYLSFVAGDPKNSGLISDSEGNSLHFYFHTLNHLENELKTNHFETKSLLHKTYKKADGTKEIHTVLIAEKRAAS